LLDRIRPIWWRYKYFIFSVSLCCCCIILILISFCLIFFQFIFHFYFNFIPFVTPIRISKSIKSGFRDFIFLIIYHICRGDWFTDFFRKNVCDLLIRWAKLISFKKCRILIDFSFLSFEHLCCFFCFFCSQINHWPICSCNPFITNKNRSAWKKSFGSVWFRTYKFLSLLENTFMIILFTLYQSFF
jgi:hypothetical protein